MEVKAVLGKGERIKCKAFERKNERTNEQKKLEMGRKANCVRGGCWLKATAR